MSQLRSNYCWWLLIPKAYSELLNTKIYLKNIFCVINFLVWTFFFFLLFLLKREQYTFTKTTSVTSSIRRYNFQFVTFDITKILFNNIFKFQWQLYYVSTLYLYISVTLYIGIWNFFASFSFLKGTLMQIRKSGNIFVVI